MEPGTKTGKISLRSGAIWFSCAIKEIGRARTGSVTGEVADSCGSGVVSDVFASVVVHSVEVGGGEDRLADCERC